MPTIRAICSLVVALCCGFACGHGGAEPEGPVAVATTKPPEAAIGTTTSTPTEPANDVEPVILEPQVAVNQGARDTMRAKLREPAFRSRFKKDPTAAIRGEGLDLAPDVKLTKPTTEGGVDSLANLDRYKDEEELSAKQTQRPKECLRPGDDCPIPGDGPGPKPKKRVRSVIATFTVEKRGCGILPEGAKDNDSFFVPLPEGPIEAVGVEVSSQGGVFGGGAYVAGQARTQLLISDGKKSKPTKNGAFAVNMRWWFNGWSEVKYTMNIYVLSSKAYGKVPGANPGNLTAPHCPVNKGLIDAFKEIKCVMIYFGGKTDGSDFTPSGFTAYPALWCPDLPKIGPIPDLKCPPSGKAGEYVCMPDLCGLAHAIGLPWPGC